MPGMHRSKRCGIPINGAVTFLDAEISYGIIGAMMYGLLAYPVKLHIWRFSLPGRTMNTRAAWCCDWFWCEVFRHPL